MPDVVVLPLSRSKFTESRSTIVVVQKWRCYKVLTDTVFQLLEQQRRAELEAQERERREDERRRQEAQKKAAEEAQARAAEEARIAEERRRRQEQVL